MPALLLLFRVGGMPFPIPVLWFPVWLLLLPLAVLARIVGAVAALFTGKTWAVFLTESLSAWSLLPGLHGLQVSVSSGGRGFHFKFI